VGQTQWSSMKKNSNSIALLKRARPFVSRHTLIKMYNAFVLPHFNYCSTIWNDGSCTIINKLSKLQRRAARVITSSTYDIRSSQILKDLTWSSGPNHRIGPDTKPI
jgi:hypothetical protein